VEFGADEVLPLDRAAEHCAWIALGGQARRLLSGAGRPRAGLQPPDSGRWRLARWWWRL
jgi:hypothetical protein